jgi:hypothetical protein
MNIGGVVYPDRLGTKKVLKRENGKQTVVAPGDARASESLCETVLAVKPCSRLSRAYLGKWLFLFTVDRTVSHLWCHPRLLSHLQPPDR